MSSRAMHDELTGRLADEVEEAVQRRSPRMEASDFTIAASSRRRKADRLPVDNEATACLHCGGRLLRPA